MPEGDKPLHEQMAGAFSVRRDPVSSELSRHLLEYITRSTIQPGERLPPERVLAETLHVGRSNVREALRVLAFLGLVEIRPGSGTYLLTPGSQLLPRAVEWSLLVGERLSMDMIEARRVIEIGIAGLAAQRASSTDIDDLRTLVGRMATDDVGEFVEADASFHLRLAESAGNTALSDMLSALQSLLRAWIRRAVESGNREATRQEHRAIVQALQDRDSAAAEGAMRAHLDSARAMLAESLHSSSTEAELR